MSHHPELSPSEGAPCSPSTRNPVQGHPSGGRYAGALQLRVAAPPTGNRANEAVAALVAKESGLSRADVSVISGASSRHKRLRLTGVDVADAVGWSIGCSPMCVDDAMTGEREDGDVRRVGRSPWMDAGSAS